MLIPIEPTILRTGRWTLRAPSRLDGQYLLETMQDNATRQWNPAGSVVDLDSAATWCESSADWSGGDHATFSILLDQDWVGTVAVHAVDRNDRVAEVGYRVHPAHRGRGGATAAVILATNWALTDLGLSRVSIRHAIANPASCGVAERAGYLLEGLLRQAQLGPDGVRYDEHLHARLTSDPIPML